MAHSNFVCTSFEIRLFSVLCNEPEAKEERRKSEGRTYRGHTTSAYPAYTERSLIQDFKDLKDYIWMIDENGILLHERKAVKVKMNHAEVIKQIKDVAERAIPANGHVMLYGSRARNNAHTGSDWDLLILLDKSRIEKNDYDDVVFPFTSLGWEIGEMIIPVIYTQEEWNASQCLPFYKNVERDKIVLK